MAIAQTRDGFLWIGSSTGLYRFDGLKFTPAPVPPGSPAITEVRALFTPPDGGIWIGHRTGVSFLKDGVLRSYSDRDGLPYGRVRGLAQTPDGAIWAGVVGGLARFAGGRWEKVRSDWQYTDKTANRLAVDTDGTLWVGGESTFHYLISGQHTFHETALPVGHTTFVTADRDGAVWLSDPGNKMVYRVRRSAANAAVEVLLKVPVAAYGVLVDSSNSVWFAGVGGIFRLPRREILGNSTIRGEELGKDHITLGDVYSGDLPLSIFQDREGNVWTGRDGGLDRLRARSVFQFHTGSIVDDIIIGPHSSVWAFSNSSSQYLMPMQNAAKIPLVAVKKQYELQCEYMDQNGVLWFSAITGPTSSSREFWKLERGKARRVPPPPGIPAPVIKGIVSDATGKLWLTISGSGEYTLKDGVWHKVPVFEGNDADLSPDAEFVDAKGRAWLVYYARETVALIDGAKRTLFSPGRGLDLGNPAVVWGSGSQVWVGGSGGVAVYDGQRFRNLHVADGTSFEGVTAILPTETDGLWLKLPEGIAQIPSEEVTSFLRSFEHAVQYRLFDGATDFTVPLVRTIPSPYGSEMARSGDGKLWFSTRDGVAMIDPKHLATNRVAPPLSIQRLSADGREYPLEQHILLPKSVHEVAIEYTALSLAFPQRNRFRYQLEGFDKYLQDAGPRRQAFYTNLPPGLYKFHVIASNNDGVWNQQGATLVFRIPPTFRQTMWFRILFAAVLCVAMALAFLWRLRQIEARARDHLAERLAERSRIARDLHDTLIQGFQGLVLRFHAATSNVAFDSDTKLLLEGVLRRADEILTEGRDRVLDLRIQDTHVESFVQRLMRCAEELSLIRKSEFGLIMEGDPRPLHSLVFDEAYWIIREAMTNAFLHSGSSRVNVRVVYARKHFTVAVHDEGVGIPSSILTKSKVGHFGLQGMRERADQIEAFLQIESVLTQGTKVELRIPARVAYTRSRNRRSTRWLSWLRSDFRRRPY